MTDEGLEKRDLPDAIKLLEHYKSDNFSGSGKIEAEARNRINEAILEIYNLIGRNETLESMLKLKFKQYDILSDIKKDDLTRGNYDI